MTRLTYNVHGGSRKADWRDSGLCRTYDPELFFSHLSRDEEAAKTICRACPVAESCLQHALEQGIEHGVWGGLTQDERKGLRRAKRRRKLTAADVQMRSDEARDAKPKPSTLQELFAENTRRLIGGHLAWTGTVKPSFKGRTYNPKQIAFIVDRGREPEGRVLNNCGLSTCVLPAHVADDAERIRCGTRAGYGRHRRNGEKACHACKQANTDANNRLLRTGTTKLAA